MIPASCFLIAGIENGMGSAAQTRAQTFRFLNTRRPHQHRTIARMLRNDRLYERLLLLRFRAEQRIRLVHADHRPVRRNHFDIKPIQSAQLFRLRGRSAGHAANAGVQRNQILQRD